MGIRTSPEERWAAQLLFRVAKGAPTFDVDAAKQLAQEVEALPAHERANRLRLLDSMTEPSRQRVETATGPVPVVIDAVSRPTSEAARFLNQFVRQHVDPAAPLVGEVFGDGRLSTSPDSVLLRGDAIDFSDSPETRVRTNEVLTWRGADGDARIALDRMGWVAVDPRPGGIRNPPSVDPNPEPIRDAPGPAPRTPGATEPLGVTFSIDASAPPHLRLHLKDARGERPASDDVLAEVRRSGSKTLDELIHALPGLPVRELVGHLLRAHVVAISQGVVTIA